MRGASASVRSARHACDAETRIATAGIATLCDMPKRTLPRVPLEAVRRLWLHRQGLAVPRGEVRLRKRSFVEHLERTGGLQLDSVNVVERAHALTLWSRFGAFDRRTVDRWVYRDRAAFDYWAHEACLVPASHLPFARRRMKRIPELWKGRSWWKHYDTSAGSRRRVLGRLRDEGPLESADFERAADEPTVQGPGWGAALPKEDKRTLTLLWHSGRIGVAGRRHFRRVFDLAERVYPEGGAATRVQEADAWLLHGLSGQGAAPERHLTGYLTAPGLKAPDRRRVLERNLRAGRVVELRVDEAGDASDAASAGRARGGARSRRATSSGASAAVRPGERWFALPEHLELLASDDALPPARGTTLLSPFDSFLWQRDRAEELLGFRYRVEIYVPEAKREHGYYVLPVLHEGRLVGRLDPKLHRDRGVLEIRRLAMEPGAPTGRGVAAKALERGLRDAVHDLADFVGATSVEAAREVPAAWRRVLG